VKESNPRPFGRPSFRDWFRRHRLPPSRRS